MKRIIAILTVVVAVALRLAAQTPETYFPYPQPPDTMTVVQDRFDYFVTHFWDHCELKKAFSNQAKMQAAMADYIQTLGLATDSVALRSVDAFMHRLDKQPKDQAFIVNEAENQLYGDSAQFYSDVLYMAFARPFVANKKADKTAKLRPAMLVRIMEATQPGQQPPALDYVTAAGEKGSTADDRGQLVILFFNDPDCDDCRLAKVRLDADMNASRLIKEGALKVVSVYPGEADDEWRAKVKDYPSTWRVVAAPTADEVYDLRMTPAFYVVHRGKILAKGLGINQVLTLLSRL